MNIIDEARFFNHFPQKELDLTSDLFASLIEGHVVEGVIQGVYLDCILDKISESERMRQFALKTLKKILSLSKADFGLKFYKKVLENQLVI